MKRRSAADRVVSGPVSPPDHKGRRQRPTHWRKSSLQPPPTCARPSKTTVLRVTHSRARTPLRRPDVAPEVNDTRTCVCILSATDAATHTAHTDFVTLLHPDGDEARAADDRFPPLSLSLSYPRTFSKK